MAETPEYTTLYCHGQFVFVLHAKGLVGITTSPDVGGHYDNDTRSKIYRLTFSLVVCVWYCTYLLYLL